jgi:hypothetical protein
MQQSTMNQPLKRTMMGGGCAGDGGGGICGSGGSIEAAEMLGCCWDGPRPPGECFRQGCVAFVDENGGGWVMDDVMMPPREICQEAVLFCMAVWPFGNMIK